MFLRIARLLCCVAAIQIFGGHWALLQSVAWVGMVMQYSEGGSLTVALEKTFDGAHPCSLCHAVKEGRDEEQKRIPDQLVIKFDAILMAAMTLEPPIERSHTYFEVPAAAAAMVKPPLTPPPLA